MLAEQRAARAQQLSAKDQEWQDVREAGWFSQWHIGFSDGATPDDPYYGCNLLQWDDPPRDPRAVPYRLVHPPEAEYRIQQRDRWERRQQQQAPRPPRGRR